MSDHCVEGFDREESIKIEKNRISYMKKHIKRRYFKTNKKVFKFMHKHQEFRIEYVYITLKHTVVLYSNKLGRPYKTYDKSIKITVKPYIKSHAVVYGKDTL